MTRAPLALRLLAALGGAALLVLATVLTLGTALGAPLGMSIASGWNRRRGARLTRLSGWAAAVAGSAAVTLLFAATALSFAPPDIVDSAREATVAEQERARTQPTRVEQALERLQPRTAATEAMERRTEAMAASETFFWLIMILSLVVVSALVGLVSGSIGWGASVLVIYGVSTTRSPVAASMRSRE